MYWPRPVRWRWYRAATMAKRYATPRRYPVRVLQAQGAPFLVAQGAVQPARAPIEGAYARRSRKGPVCPVEEMDAMMRSGLIWRRSS